MNDELIKKPESEVSEKPKNPLGNVPREFTMQDRRLILQSLDAYCKKDNRGDSKHLIKFQRIRTLLRYQELEEYYDMISDHVMDLLEKWSKAHKEYAEAKEKGEDWKALERPSRRRPDAEPKDIRGPSVNFPVPSRLDVLIKDAVKAMQFDPSLAEYVVELYTKLDIKDEDGD